MFSGDNLMFGLLGIYTIIFMTFIFEKNYPKALYWFGALTITSAVLWMK